MFSGNAFGRIWRKGKARLGIRTPQAGLLDLPPVDFLGLGLTPAQALVRAGGLRFVIDAPLQHCRGLGPSAFVIAQGGRHPLVETCLALMSDPGLSYERSPLRSFLEAFNPRNAAEILGLPSSHPGYQGPPESWSFPWTETDAKEVARRDRNLRTDKAAGGYVYFGHTSQENGENELARLRRVLEDIGSNGFRLAPGRDGLVRAEILSSGVEWRARVQVGQHRTAALAALGAGSVPLWPEARIVRREAAADWPAVQAGAISLSDALMIFDRVFAGEQPPVLDRTRLVEAAPPAGAHAAQRA